MTFEDRFWSKVDLGDQNECWLWRGALTRGYGVLGRGGRGTGNVFAHRAAYEMLVGPIPDDLHHRCENKRCVNPAHLECVTQKEHSARHRKCDHADRHVRSDGRSECRTCRLEKERERWKDPAFRERIATRKRHRRLTDPEWREKERAICRANYRARVAEP